VMLPVPLSRVQVPVPAPGLVPLKVAIPLEVAMSNPALMVNELFVMITLSELTHPLLLSVQRKVFTPLPRPVTEVLFEVELLMLAVPLCKVQTPELATPAKFPVRTASPAQTDWSRPASAKTELLVMITSSEAAQELAVFVTVHSKVFAPGPRLVTLVVKFVGVTTVPRPAVFVQRPVAPAEGATAVKVTVLTQTAKSVPAFAVTELLVMMTLSLDTQPRLTMVQRKVLAPAPRLETTVLYWLMFPKLPEPLTRVHVPVPVVGMLPDSVAELTQTP